jgi:hypothetical protein
MGFRLLLLMFAAVILGGLGTAFGAMVGGIVIGIVVQVSSVFFSPDLGFAWALGILILVLLVRPQSVSQSELAEDAKVLASRLYALSGVRAVRSADDPLGDFPPDRTMGLLTGLTLTCALLADWFLLPPLLLYAAAI